MSCGFFYCGRSVHRDLLADVHLSLSARSPVGTWLARGMQERIETTVNSSSANVQHFILGLWGVRYQVKDVQRSIAFYTQTLGFQLDMQHPPAFGQVSVGELKLILSGPGASGSRPLPDGRQQEP